MKKGFSLAEIVVATGILSLIILAFAMVMNSSYKVFYYSQNELSALSQAATIMRDFEKNTRGAGANATTFEDYAANKLTFYAFIKGDAYAAPSKISYYFEGNVLKKSVIAPEGSSSPYTYPDANKKVTTFAGTITNHNIFTYYGEDNTTVLNPVQPVAIRMIKIDVTVAGKVPASETTVVNLRNLKTNL